MGRAEAPWLSEDRRCVVGVSGDPFSVVGLPPSACTLICSSAAKPVAVAGLEVDAG